MSPTIGLSRVLVGLAPLGPAYYSLSIFPLSPILNIRKLRQSLADRQRPAQPKYWECIEGCMLGNATSCSIGGKMDRLRSAEAPSSGRATTGALCAAAACGMVLLGLALTGPASAQRPLAGWSDPMQATSSYAAQQEAMRAIPLDKLDADTRRKAVSVLNNVTAYRRLPVRVVCCDPRLYALVVCHPDVVVNIWEVLGISQLKLRQTAPETFRVDETEGTSAVLQFIYHDRKMHVIYGEWSYSGKLFAEPVRGRCLAMLRCSCVRDGDGAYYITNRLDGFISVEPGGVELLTKISPSLDREDGRRQFHADCGLRRQPVADGGSERPRRATVGRQAQSRRAAGAEAIGGGRRGHWEERPRGGRRGRRIEGGRRGRQAGVRFAAVAGAFDIASAKQFVSGRRPSR